MPTSRRGDTATVGVTSGRYLYCSTCFLGGSEGLSFSYLTM